MKQFPKPLKWIAGWLLFFSIATFLFMLLLGLIIRSDWLTDSSWFALLVCVPVAVIVILCILIRWFFTWRNLRRAIIVLAWLAIAAALFYAEEDFRGWYAWHHFKQQEEAKGERFDFASVVPPPVPDDKNFALTPIVASCWESQLTKDGKRIVPEDTNVINRLEMGIYKKLNWDNPTTNGYWPKGTFTDLAAWQIYYRTHSTNYDLVTNEFPIASQPQSPAQDVLLAMSKYDLAIEELRKASVLPYSRFPMDYTTTNLPSTPLPHLSGLKGCVQVLQKRAEAELESGQSDKAFDDVKLSFRLIDSVRNEPFFISHLVRVAELQIMLQPVWEGMMKHEWTDAQLAEIESELSKLDFLKDCQLTMRGERDSAFALFDYLKSNRSYKNFRELFSYPEEEDHDWRWDEWHRAIIYHLVPGGWFDQNKVAVAELHQKYLLPMANLAEHLGFPQMASEFDTNLYSMPSRPWNYLVKMFVPALEVGERKLIYEQEVADMAQIGSALERYRLAHNEYPKTLDALAPQFIPQIPHDIIGGKPLHYRRTNDGKYILYSVGWNETDDNGTVELRPNSTSVDITKGDWVWPCP